VQHAPRRRALAVDRVDDVEDRDVGRRPREPVTALGAGPGKQDPGAHERGERLGEDGEGSVGDPRQLAARDTPVVVYAPPPGTPAARGRCTFVGGLVDEYDYRETVSPWFRSVFTLQPKGDLMVDTPFLFQSHVTIACLLYAVWRYTRLVHVWSVPVGYLARSPIVYRGKRGATRTALR
jgi:hypothetical protein